MYKLFLTLRYLRKRRIVYFAIAAVTLCVAMVLIVLSVMGGWLDMVMQQARGLLGDIVVDNKAYAGFPLYQEFIDEISTWPEIVAATPVIYSYGLFYFKQTEQSGMVRVVGIRPPDVYEVNAFKDSLFYERYYPGTTHLGEQQQPLWGFDMDGPPLTLTDPTGETFQAYGHALPSPYQEALEQARRAYAAARPAGADLVLRDPDSLDTPLNEERARYGLPPIPGWYRQNLAEPRAALQGDALPGLIFGRDIVARRLSDGRYDRYYPRGMVTTLTLMATSIHAQVDPIPIKQAFRYVDDSRTGVFDIDSQHVYCDFRLLQDLLRMGPAERVDVEGRTIGTAPARCSQIQIKVAPGAATPARLSALTTRLAELYHSYLDDERFELDFTERQLVGRVSAMTWQESQAHIFAPVQKEKALVTILFGIISLVAVALILCILYMIVLQKTRDIGIVKAIGGSTGGVALIFVLYGAAVGVTGAALGTMLGVVFVTNINEIQDFLIALNPAWRVWDLEVYSFDRIPSAVDVPDAVFVALAAVAAATLGSLVAALRAGFMHPVEALRHE